MTILQTLLRELRRQRKYPGWQPEKGKDGWVLHSTAYDQPINLSELAKALEKK